MPSTPKYFDLKHRVVAVTGGSRGLGFAMVQALAESGAKVVIGSPSDAENQTALANLGQYGDAVRAHRLDVTSRDSCDLFVDFTVKEFGTLNTMICNAGVSIFAPALQTTSEMWRKTIDIDLEGVFNSAVSAARYMVNAGGGSIVVTSSNGSMIAFEGLSAYGAAKGGVNQLIRQLATEWGPHGIRVNGVAPGWTNHRMEGNAAEIHEAVAASAIARTPLRRFGNAEEIASAALFFVSEASSFVTGTVLAVDGGYTAC